MLEWRKSRLGKLIKILSKFGGEKNENMLCQNQNMSPTPTPSAPYLAPSDKWVQIRENRLQLESPTFSSQEHRHCWWLSGTERCSAATVVKQFFFWWVPRCKLLSRFSSRGTVTHDVAVKLRGKDLLSDEKSQAEPAQQSNESRETMRTGQQFCSRTG